VRPVVLTASQRRARCLLFLMACLTLGVLGLEALEADAATPSSLAGETFISHHVRGSTLTGTCPDTSPGTNGSYNFSVNGIAAGPFPGTFTESGSFTTSLSGHLLTFSSNFTIKDAAGTATVTGAKSLSMPDASEAICTAGGVGGTELDGSISTTYRATIAGAGQDSGNANISIVDDAFGSVTPTLFFSESFGSTGAVAKQCRESGWMSFGTLFKNQGDCVSFFATGGKNQPAGL
jgi:hypothetical protein